MKEGENTRLFFDVVQGKMMETRGLVTVYILIYKNMKRISELLESIARQTYKEIELLISDDGSPNITEEDLLEVVRPYEKRFTNVIINKNRGNNGTVRHINGIIPKMHGKILCGIAADDMFYNNDVIESIVDFFNENEAIDIVTSKRYDESSGLVQPIEKVQEVIKNHFDRYKKIMFRATPLISGAGTFFRKDLFKKYGYFPEEFRLVEDASFFSKLVSEGVRFGFLDKITIFHGAGGVSDKNVIPHPWYEADMDYLYSTWLYSLIPLDDKFSYRCVTYHKKRRLAKNTFQILILYMRYVDVCMWILKFYSGK